MKGIKFVAPFRDNSGYAEASRQFIKGLVQNNIPVTIKYISHEKNHPDLGKETESLLKSLEAKIDYDVVLVHLTPEHFPYYKEEGKFNIGYIYWETSKLHPEWIPLCNSMDAMLVGCDWNKESFSDSGIKVPVLSNPPGIDTKEFENKELYRVKGLPDDVFKFYSIFQWTERKNPTGLLMAYWNAFKDTDKVALILKTYRSNYETSEVESIKSIIGSLKQHFPLPHKHPPIYFVSNMLSREEIVGLHLLGDCLVYLSRGEGLGLPHMEAACAGNPVIATNLGGHTMFMDESNSYLIDYSWTPVFGMPWIRWYLSDQMWAEPDIGHAINTMRHVYDHQDEAKEKGLMFKNKMKTDFSWNTRTVALVENINKLLNKV